MRSAELGAMGLSSCQLQVFFAALFLATAALLASLTGVLLILAKEACSFCTGSVPEAISREPAGAREALLQAFALGLPWHCRKVAQRLRRTRNAQKRRCCVTLEGPRAWIKTFLYSLLAPASAAMIMIAKLVQALQLFLRLAARWASPRHVTAPGPPVPLRACSQQYGRGGLPIQFSRAAAPALSALKPSLWTPPRADWLVRELPRARPDRDEQRDALDSLQFSEEEVREEEVAAEDGLDEDSSNGPWGWVVLLRNFEHSQLLLLRPQALPGGLETTTPSAPTIAWSVKGQFSKVELLGTPPRRLRCHFCKAGTASIAKSFSKDMPLLPSAEAAFVAFSVAMENQCKEPKA